MKNAGFVLMVLVASWSVFAAEDFRPPFDKSDYKGRVGIQLNPWWPAQKDPVYGEGGPNVSYIHHTGTSAQVWRQAMELCARYGVDVLVPEINEPQAWSGCWRVLLDQAGTNRPPVRIGMFFGMYSKDKESVIASMKKVLTPFREDLKSHPAVSRAGGYPVMVVYNPTKFKPSEWREIFDVLDAEFGRMVYLLNIGELAVQAARGGGGTEAQDARFEQLLRESLPYWDGISSYGNGCRVAFPVIRKVMKDFPQKINEGQGHFVYCNHFHMGGDEVPLSQVWRDHLSDCYSSDPDSILLTNLLDQYENSAIYPCYEREDLLLRYLEWTLEKWKGRKFPRRKEPELVVCNYTMVLLGWQSLDFEVLGFPLDAKETDVRVTLEICDTFGKVLYTFPEKRMDLNAFRAERFSVPSTQFAGERGVVPRLRYKWAGRDFAMNYGPMTLIDPSIRSYRMFWARSTKNALWVNGKNKWTLDGVGVGGTHQPSRTGHSRFTANIKPTWSGENSGSVRAGIRRDNTEFCYTDSGANSLSREITIPIPPPRGALHWYHLEMENAKGCKFQTLPIWDEDGSRARAVTLPVKTEAGSIADFKMEETRIPFWYYPIDEDYGKVMLDVSGWDHHGHIHTAPSGYGGGHLSHTGYNHGHNGYVAPSVGDNYRSLFRRDSDGRGYLTFDGTNDYVVVMGGTAFPAACTYELSVRPAELGREMGLVGTVQNALSIALLANGAVEVTRKGTRAAKPCEKAAEFTGKIVSSAKLRAGEWAKIAVTYDLRKVRLYVNGALAGELESGPFAGHESLTHVILGAKCGWVYTPNSHFKGDLRAIRIYGRNLAPAEFL